MIHFLFATSMLTQTPDTSRLKPAPASLQSAMTAAPLDSTRVLPFGEDKVQHFLMTFGIYGFAYAGNRALGMKHDTALLDAGIAAAGAGFGKEIYDRVRGKRFSGLDLIADLIGGTAAYALARQVR